MNIEALLKCETALKDQLGANAPIPFNSLKRGEAENRVFLQVISERLISLEGEVSTLNDKFRVVREAETVWQLAMRARDKAIFVNQCGDVAVLPSELVNVLATGRAADVKIAVANGAVTLDDERGSRSTVPLSFFINMGRVLKQWDSPLGPTLSSISSKTEVTS